MLGIDKSSFRIPILKKTLSTRLSVLYLLKKIPFSTLLSQKFHTYHSLCFIIGDWSAIRYRIVKDTQSKRIFDYLNRE